MVLNKTSLYCFLLLLGLSFICYYPALNAPFYLDDFGSITGNAKLSSIEVADLLQSYGLRFVGYFSFALNTVYVGAEPLHFRLINILIHVFVSFSIYTFIKLLFVANANKVKLNDSLKYRQLTAVTYQFWIPLFLACLYLMHPLNTQAVTYIVQRLASLVTLFYIFACVAYLIARLSTTKTTRYFATVVCIVCGMLAMLTKQNAATLPLVILLLECFFFANKSFKKLLILLSVSFVAILGATYLFNPFPSFFSAVDSATKETTLISRAEYFSTQLIILWDYILKFFIPTGLQLNYANIINKGITSQVTIAAIVGHVAAILFAVLVKKNNPLIALGILFYYITHIIESSIIPITDVGFEHRTYLPNVGLVIILAGILSSLVLEKINKIQILASLIILGVLGYLTLERNVLWADKLAFAKNEVSIAPDSIRAHTMLASVYVNDNKPVEALAEYEAAINLSATRNQVSFDLLRDYIRVLYTLGQYESAGPLTTLVMKYTNGHRRKDRSEIMALIAVSHIQAGRLGFAKGLLNQSLRLDPKNGFATYQLGSVLWKMGEQEKAMKLLEEFAVIKEEDKVILQLYQQMQSLKQVNTQ
ncbi:tetratricopeptide repeat protein [Shewanella donghaensis]|uniref:tetratricopeptide repeat protein n=1 Tax=Shewanella donghaensis TaxID=238836 RepID=UPI0011841B7B|nr:hypothetical protein [Shewanella donghaensis]